LDNKTIDTCISIISMNFIEDMISKSEQEFTNVSSQAYTSQHDALYNSNDKHGEEDVAMSAQTRYATNLVTHPHMTDTP